jgi:hypothetical protein
MHEGHDSRNGRPAVREDRVDEILCNLRRRAEHDTWMMTSLMLALCAVLVVAVLVLPQFGLRVAAVTAMATILGIVMICYLACITRATAHKRPRVRDLAERHRAMLVAARGDELPEDPPGDRLLAALLILATGAFVLMLVWLVGH